MIQTLWLANYIENQLNNNNLGKKFLVFADEGDMRETRRKCGKTERYTNCLLEVMSNTLVPIRNISFQTFNLQLMLIVDLMASGLQNENQYNREQSTNLIDIKSILGGFINSLNGQTFAQEIDGKTYNMTITFGTLTDGQKMELGDVNEALPLYLSMTFTFFENGVNANDTHIYLNNEDLYFTRYVVSKVKTTDQNEYAGGTKGAKSYVLIGGKSIDMVIPVVNTPIGKKIMEDILGDEINEAYCVRVVTPLYEKRFIGILGNDTLNADAGANLGYNLSIVEGKENELKYGENWQIETTTEQTITKTILGQKTVFWGDNTSDYVEAGGELTHSYTDNKEKHIIRIYGE